MENWIKPINKNKRLIKYKYIYIYNYVGFRRKLQNAGFGLLRVQVVVGRGFPESLQPRASNA